jgi:ketosteroid isomerase-like protein
MSQENLELTRRAYAAFNRGDLEDMLAYLAPDFEYLTTGAIPGVEGVYRGPEGFRQFLESFWGEFDEPGLEVRELIEAEDRVLAGLTFQGRGKQSGVETTWNLWHVWTVRGGKAVLGQAFTSREQALEAAGLSE